MKIFICFRSVDKSEGEAVITSMLACSENTVAILKEVEHSSNWKQSVEDKFKQSDFVIFLIGRDTFKSEQIIWEYAKVKELNKQIVGIRLNDISEESILFCQGFQVFDNAPQCFIYLTKIFDVDRQLRIEQYKMMVSSTENVTSQRLTVNNLFFTITSSILSVAFVLGKAFHFSIFGVLIMTLLTLFTLLVCFFWQKLVGSYAKLNQGKFRMINKIEKELRTNMFEEEWKILVQEIQYESNSDTEISVIKGFRIFIIIIAILEFLYFLYKLYQFRAIFICNQ